MHHFSPEKNHHKSFSLALAYGIHFASASILSIYHHTYVWDSLRNLSLPQGSWKLLELKISHHLDDKILYLIDPANPRFIQPCHDVTFCPFSGQSLKTYFQCSMITFSIGLVEIWPTGPKIRDMIWNYGSLAKNYTVYHTVLTLDYC